MWNYPPPLDKLLPEFNSSRMDFKKSGLDYSIDVFGTMKAQTGSYIESPGRYLKDNMYSVSDIPIEKLFLMDTCVLNIDYEKLNEKNGKKFVSLENIKSAEKEDIPEGSAILVGTGYGRDWSNKDYFENSWFFKKDAMDYLIEKKPYLLGADSAEWENSKDPEGIFKAFFPANILILANCINIEKIKNFNVKLIVLPLKVKHSYIAPVRAIVIED